VACPIRAARPKTLIVAALSPEENAFSAEDAAFLEALSSLISTGFSASSETRPRTLPSRQPDRARQPVLLRAPRQALQQARRQRWSVAVLFVDLDRFNCERHPRARQRRPALAEASRRCSLCAGSGHRGRISATNSRWCLADLARPTTPPSWREGARLARGSFQLASTRRSFRRASASRFTPGDADDADTLLKNADTASTGQGAGATAFASHQR